MKKVLKYLSCFFIALFVLIPLVHAETDKVYYKCEYYYSGVIDGSFQNINILNTYYQKLSDDYFILNSDSFEYPKQDVIKARYFPFIFYGEIKQINMIKGEMKCPEYCIAKLENNGTATDYNVIILKSDKCIANLTIKEPIEVSEKYSNIFDNISDDIMNNDDNSNNNNNNNNNSNPEADKIRNEFIGNTTCGGLTYFTFPKIIPKITSTVYTLIKIAIPVILIIKGILDMFKAVAAQKEDEMKKAQKKFFQRLVAGIIALLVFIIVETVINFIANRTGNNNAMKCVNCFINNECQTVDNNSNSNDRGPTGGHGGTF